MLIFINGTYGVGKSTIANKISETTKIKMLNSDEIYSEMIDKDVSKAFGTGATPQTNKNLLIELKNRIEESRNKDLIIDMAITTTVAKESIIDYFINRKIEIKHIILFANDEFIKNRINNDVERIDKTLALDELSNNNKFLVKEFSNGIFINIENKTKDTISREIIKIINS